MYRLTIFVLVSCLTSQQLVEAFRRGGSPSRRSSLYFDAYDRQPMEDVEESEDGLKEAVLMHPEEILDAPPVPVKRNYERMDLDIEPLLEESDYPHARGSQLERSLIHDLLEQIQLAFSNWPPGLPSRPPSNPVFYYQFDSSLLENQKTVLKVLLATVEEKTCNIIIENAGSPHIIFMGVEGCSIESDSNRIIIGFECFEPNMIVKLMFKLFGFCEGMLPDPMRKASGLYLHSFRSNMQREAELGNDCNDKFNFCAFLANGNSSLPCGSPSDAKNPMCSTTCSICDDTCGDYDSDCKTQDTVRDCLLDWDWKKLHCAKTCGVCKTHRDPDSCFDYVGCCKFYASRGYCQRIPTYMKQYCSLSCGYCTPKPCEDERNDCYELKRMGACTKMTALMEKNCRRTCNLCGNGVENRDNDERMPSDDCKRDDDFISHVIFAILSLLEIAALLLCIGIMCTARYI